MGLGLSFDDICIFYLNVEYSLVDSICHDVYTSTGDIQDVDTGCTIYRCDYTILLLAILASVYSTICTAMITISIQYIYKDTFQMLTQTYSWV